MSDIGPLLKKARQDLKLTLDDVQEITKIRKKYIEAIEESNYKILPGAFYIKAFIKSFAEAVGLQPDEVIKLHEKSSPLTKEEMPYVEPIRSNKSSSPKNIDKINRFLTNMVLISFIILIVGVIYYFASQNYTGTPNSKITDVNNTSRITDQVSEPVATPVPTPTVAPKVPAATPEPIATVTYLKSENGIDIYSVTNTDRIELSLRIITDRCWIQIDTITQDQIKTMVKQKIYALNDIDQFSLDQSVYLNIGVASAVVLNVNGTEIAFPEYFNPKRVQFNLQKIN